VDVEHPRFVAGDNVAMKVPLHRFDATVRFYRDTVGLPPIEVAPPSACFAFGALRLWIDPVPQIGHAELWLELRTPDLARAAARLQSAGVVRCDAIEALPPDLSACWISNPAGIVHLLREEPVS
jgi:hypothetical protein